MNTTATIDHKFFGEDLVAQSEEHLPKALTHLQEVQEKTCTDAQFTGWFDYPQISGFRLADSIRKFLDTNPVSYDLVVVIGIGGSYLGTRAVIECMKHTYEAALPNTKPMVTFLGHHLSESAMIEALELVADRLPIVNVISKSGTTTEPSVAFRIVKKYMEDRFGKVEAAKRIIATTDKEKGALRELAEKEGYQTFIVPDDIGGRFSVLSAVGLVPLALAQIDIEGLLKGADNLFQEVKNQAEGHPVLHYATNRFAAYNAGKKIEILSYSNPKLLYFVEWWKQLFGESEGKDGKGLFPTGVSFTSDLHSLGQYVQEGERIILETFLRFKEESCSGGAYEKQLRVPKTGNDNDKIQYLEGLRVEEINSAAMDATKVAHFDGGVPCLEISVPILNEEGVGYLFAFFETACAVSGLLLGVNPFDQPGVEAYKKNLFALMGRPGFEEMQESIVSRLKK